MKYLSKRSELPCKDLFKWAKLSTSKYHTWLKRYGKINGHNGKIPRDWWLEEWEKQPILDFHDKDPLKGYRRITSMMLDDDIVAVSPSSTYRVLKNAGRLDRRGVPPSKKVTCFIQPTKIHQELHIDVSYINTSGTFYFLISLFDGVSRYIVHSELSETMKELDIELVIAKEIEKHPAVKHRIISDNGPRFIANDFKAFAREYGLIHVRTSPYYPQSNGKLERWNGSLESECIRPGSPATQEEAERRIGKYLKYYNTV
jgi:putative transposase